MEKTNMEKLTKITNLLTITFLYGSQNAVLCERHLVLIFCSIFNKFYNNSKYRQQLNSNLFNITHRLISFNIT